MFWTFKHFIHQQTFNCGYVKCIISLGCGTMYRWLRSNWKHFLYNILHTLICVAAYPVAPHIHQLVLFQRIKHNLLHMAVCNLYFIFENTFKIKICKNNIVITVPGASPYGVFPNQPQLYATQGPAPPAPTYMYDQTLTHHPMVYIYYWFFETI